MVVNGIALAIGFFLVAISGLGVTGFGILAILMACLNFFLIIGYMIAGNRNGMLNALILTGVLFTIGFSICSGYTINMH
jgi:hypothetical protein